MYLISVLILSAIVTVQTKIVIEIEPGKSVSETVVNFSGFDEAEVGDKEIKLFNIDNLHLKRAVRSKYGETPRDVFLKSPTPWGDLYTQYQWKPVTRIMKVKSAIVKESTIKSIAVLAQDFKNSFNNTIKVNAGISQTVENSFSTSWSMNKETSISQEIEYDLNVILAKISGTTGFTYTSSFGRSEEKSETVTLGTSASMETELQPGQSATAVLSANRFSLELEIEYALSLHGVVAVNFRKKYDGHHFYGPSINSVLKSGGLPTEVIVTENVKIGLFVDASLHVFDKITKIQL